MMLNIILVAAMDLNNAIGKNNQLPWHCPNDLKRFKQLTSHQTILMGRKTAESLGRALPNRTNLVLTRSNSVPYPGMQAMSDVDSVKLFCKENAVSSLFIIGGEQLYRLMLPVATQLYLTKISAHIPDTDTFFPEIDYSKWNLIKEESNQADDSHPYSYLFLDYILNNKYYGNIK